MKFGCSNGFSSILQIWYVEVRISRSVLEGPFDFKITRVDCISITCCLYNSVFQIRECNWDNLEGNIPYLLIKTLIVTPSSEPSYWDISNEWSQQNVSKLSLLSLLIWNCVQVLLSSKKKVLVFVFTEIQICSLLIILGIMDNLSQFLAHLCESTGSYCCHWGAFAFLFHRDNSCPNGNERQKWKWQNCCPCKHTHSVWSKVYKKALRKPLKPQTKIAADNTLFFFYFYLSKEIRLDVSCKSSA